MNIGYAKNETLELVLGNAFIASGGFFAGFRVDLLGVQINTVMTAILIGVGIFFDLRVLRKFAKELSLTKQELGKTEKALKETDRKTFGIFSHSSRARPLEDRVKNIERKVDELERRIKKVDFRLDSL